MLDDSDPIGACQFDRFPYLVCFFMMLNRAIDPHLPALARVCGRTMILTFLVVPAASSFPINLNSSSWGSQISNRILDAGVLPMIGVTLLCSACFLESGVDSRRHPNAAKRLLRHRESSRWLIQVGMESLILLAILQVPLFIGNLNQIDQQRTVESWQISAQLIAAGQA
jgi:hypothetical protein